MNQVKELDRVMIGVDPHKASWTAVAVGSSLQPLGTIRVPVNRLGYRSLRGFAAQWPGAAWAIEGASGLGAPLTRWLAHDQIPAVDVPAKLAARVRMLSRGHGRKNDDSDAASVGIAALTAPGLQLTATDETIVALRALVDIATTWSRSAPKRSTGCMCSSPASSPAGRHVTSTLPPPPSCCVRCGPKTTRCRSSVGSPAS